VYHLSWCYFAARYCVDPPAPPSNGGKYDWDPNLTGVTRFNSKVKYTCDVARKFENVTASGNNGSVVLYDTQVLMNKTDS